MMKKSAAAKEPRVSTLPPLASKPSGKASTVIPPEPPVVDPEKVASAKDSEKKAEVAPVVNLEREAEAKQSPVSQEVVVIASDIAEASPLPSVEFSELHRLLGSAHEVIEFLSFQNMPSSSPRGSSHLVEAT